MISRGLGVVVQSGGAAVRGEEGAGSAGLRVAKEEV